MRKIVCLIVVLSGFVMGCSSSSDDDTLVVVTYPVLDPTNTIQSIITLDNPGKLIDVFFYDVKQGNMNITTESQANEIFKFDDSNGLRIPIRGEDYIPAHPSEGVVVADLYKDILTSINLAKQARGTKEFKIFASKKLNNQTSFPSWVKDANGIIPEKYAILLADFIEFMISNGVQIDYLGIDNEYVYNEGQITPQKYSETIASLRILALNRSFEMPLLVGYDDYGPNKRDWVKTLVNSGWGDTMDIYGTHYYPKYRPMSKLLIDLELIGNTPFWSTEPHWDAKADINDFDEAEAGIVTLWDQIDAGMSGFMWWNYDIDNNVRSKLMRAVSAPLLGAKPIRITDIDGEDITELGKLQTRAFIEDKIITVYAVNMNSTVQEEYTFKVEDSSIEGEVVSLQWTETSSINGVVKLIDPEGDAKNIFSLTLPKRSISRFIFNIK